MAWGLLFLPYITMQQEKPNRLLSPFFEVLSDAEAIQVRELPGNAIATKEQNQRTFVVTVKAPASKEIPSNVIDADPPRDYLLESAELLIKNKDYLLARNIFSYLLKRDIRDGHALKGLGICLFRLGDNVAARKCFRAYHELFNEEEGLVWLGLSEASQRNDRQAEEYLRKIKDPNRMNPELLFDYHRELGNVYMRLNELDRAESSYRNALMVDGGSDTLFVNLGTLSIQRNDYKAAQMYFTKALALNPNNAKAYCGLGLTAQELGQSAFAEVQFEKALEKDPQNFVALSQLVKFAESEGKINALRSRVEKFLEHDSRNSNGRYLHAICEFKSGRYSTCQKEIDALLKEDPNHMLATRLRGDLVKYLKGWKGGNA